MCLPALLSFNAVAEQKFYTWVDERGITHSVPIQESSEPKNTEKKAKASSRAQKNILSTDEFLTEEELEKKLKQEQEEHPPFFTWTDGQGQLRSQPIPQVEAPTTRLDNFDITDYTLLRSFRIGAADSMNCCAQFAKRFGKPLVERKSLVLNYPDLNRNFPTRDGLASAWYVKLPMQVPNPDNFPVLSIKIRHSEQPVSLIGLAQDYSLLHFLPTMRSQYVAETWRSIAYNETLISFADAAVAAIILYFPEPVVDATTIELKWLP